MDVLQIRKRLRGEGTNLHTLPMLSSTKRTKINSALIPVLGGLFWCMLAVAICSTGVHTMRVDGHFTPDSVFYADAGQNIAAGRGFNNSMTILHENPLPLPRATTMWGPMFPLAIAVCSTAGMPAPAAALFLPTLFGCILLVVCYLLCRRLYDGPSAMLAVAFLVHFQPLTMVMKHAWSETMGLCFGALGFLLLVVARQQKTPIRTGFLILLGGLALGIAASTRYALMPLLPVALLLIPRRASEDKGGPGIPVRSFELRFWLGNCAVLGAAFCALVVPVLARSYYLTGQIGTMRGGAISIDYVETAMRFLGALRDSLRLETDLGVAVLAIMLCGVLVNFRFYQGLGWRGCLRFVFIEHARYLLWAWALGYVLFLFYSQTRIQVDAVGTRLLFPGSLFLFLFLTVTLAHLSRWPASVRIALALVVLAPVGFSQVPIALRMLDMEAIAPHDYGTRAARSPFLQQIAAYCDKEDLIIAENGTSLSLSLGPRDVYFFRPEALPEEQLTLAEIRSITTNESQCKSYEKIWLAIENREGSRDQLERLFGPFMADLLRPGTQDYPGIELTAATDAAFIYELICPEDEADSPVATTTDDDSSPQG
jgi:hypothetical protein